MSKICKHTFPVCQQSHCIIKEEKIVLLAVQGVNKVCMKIVTGLIEKIEERNKVKNR